MIVNNIDAFEPKYQVNSCMTSWNTDNYKKVLVSPPKFVWHRKYPCDTSSLTFPAARRKAKLVLRPSLPNAFGQLLFSLPQTCPKTSPCPNCKSLVCLCQQPKQRTGPPLPLFQTSPESRRESPSPRLWKKSSVLLQNLLHSPIHCVNGGRPLPSSGFSSSSIPSASRWCCIGHYGISRIYHTTWVRLGSWFIYRHWLIRIDCAVFSVVTACLGGISVFEYFYRLYNLFRKKSRARPLNAPRARVRIESDGATGISLT